MSSFIGVSDSESGFRAYGRKALSEIKIRRLFE